MLGVGGTWVQVGRLLLNVVYPFGTHADEKNPKRYTNVMLTLSIEKDFTLVPLQAKNSSRLTVSLRLVYKIREVKTILSFPIIYGISH